MGKDWSLRIDCTNDTPLQSMTAVLIAEPLSVLSVLYHQSPETWFKCIKICDFCCRLNVCFYFSLSESTARSGNKVRGILSFVTVYTSYVSSTFRNALTFGKLAVSFQLSHVTRKSVFWVCDKVILKPASYATEVN